MGVDDPHFFYRPYSQLTLATLETLKDPQVRANIIPLQQALEQWRYHDDRSLLIGRVTQLPHMHIPLDFVETTYEWLTLNDKPFMIYSHGPSYSTQEKIGILKADRRLIADAIGTDLLPQPLKTITVKYKNKVLLVSGEGDFKLSNDMKEEIGDGVEGDSKALRKSQINDKDWDTALLLGLSPGIVGPIFDSVHFAMIRGVCYILPEGRPNHFVVIAVTPIDSIIMSAKDFTEDLDAYAKNRYHGSTKSTSRMRFYING